ncbi:1-phosphatidylinositol 4,5-bisphosphate phosphodiesterase eta-2-like [Megalops cyprinoides]|uniref:1-phosphatidylinositol 4,5-bisphosphate phosphodiesterase eta-2-like n=1 Tax=Megalops cyprinoides TaxID=118141 RepID=UPI001864D4B6|nr:1-phosphatidylinositol 4,5-bisphosphate phosphodiesterase eta-2-like [Megalops cyprinoides]
MTRSSPGKGPPPSPGTRPSSPFRSPTPVMMTSPKLWQKASISRLAEEFFWIGGSIVATPKWRMGQIVERCVSSMQAGTQMTKLRGSSKSLTRYYYLDEHKSCIRWRPSRKNQKAKIPLDSIREVCEGKQSEMFQRYTGGNFDPNCCFSVYYGDHVESLDLVTTTGEEARTWITGLKYLMAGISDEDSLAKRQRTRDQWLKQTFEEADKNGDGCLSIGEVLQLLHKLNVNLPRQQVKQMFKEADTDENQGTLGFEEFCTFYKTMSTRRDLYLLMLTYSNHKDHLDLDDLVRFLEIEQKMSNVTKDHCLEIVNKFEPCPENQLLLVLGIDGFTNYMRSPAGDIFNPEHYEVHQDMTQPLCNYFINSSHNTYLVGDQLLSQSRVDMYGYVLQAGCRCVEVDCWDGPDGEPIVHHGYTLTSKILFKDVVETINKYAFAKNQYPVILSIENHCTVPQQKKMAQYLVEVLQDKVDLSDVDMHECTRLPSPEMLKGKVLVKGKKLGANIDENADEGDVSDEDSGDEIEDDCRMSADGKGEDGTDTGEEANSSTNKRLGRSLMGSFKRKRRRVRVKKRSSLEDTDTDQESPSSATRTAVVYYSRRRKTMRLARALSDLVKYTKSVHVHDIETQAITCSWQVSSLSETKANQIMQLKPTQFIRFNQRQLVRIYPSSYRVDSSNYNPQPFWNCGCHLVALNYQSEGRMLQLNRAKFSSNGNCGYILKPKCMCKGAFNPMLQEPLPDQAKTQLVLKIISGQQLPKPKDSMFGDRGEIIDPFVEVEIIGLPVDCCKNQTRVVDDNGFNPMWEETLVFTLHMPQIALVRFLVWDHDPIGRDFIGQRTIAFTSMMPGYRHVYLEGMEEASIFVHIAVNDITGKVKPTSGIKGLFHRNQKQGSLDTSTADCKLKRRPTFSKSFLRRTASVPTKNQPKIKKDRRPSSHASENGSDGEPDGTSQAVSNHAGNPTVDPNKMRRSSQEAGSTFQSQHRGAQSEPLKRANRVQIRDPPERKQGIFDRLSNDSPGRARVASSCIKWVIRSKEGSSREFRSPSLRHGGSTGPRRERAASEPRRSPEFWPKDWPLPKMSPSPQTRRSLDAQCGNRATDPSARKAHSWSIPRRLFNSPATPDPEIRPNLNQQRVPHSEHCKNGERLERPGRSLDAQHGNRSNDPAAQNARSWNVPRRRFPSPVTFSPDSKSSLDQQRAPHSEHGNSGKRLGRTRQSLDARRSNHTADPSARNARSWSVPRRRVPSPVTPDPGSSSSLSWQSSPYSERSVRPGLTTSSCHTLSDSDSSLDSLEGIEFLPSRWPNYKRGEVGTLQREMSALFDKKMEEIRNKSPIFFTGKI